MSPLPEPVDCPHPRLVKLLQFKGEHVVCGAHVAMSEQREDELAWHERVLDEKEQELNKIEETLAEKERTLKAAVETIQKGLAWD
jgi:hypothetical protein